MSGTFSIKTTTGKISLAIIIYFNEFASFLLVTLVP